jgi:hypothetical protein
MQTLEDHSQCILLKIIANSNSGRPQLPSGPMRNVILCHWCTLHNHIHNLSLVTDFVEHIESTTSVSPLMTAASGNLQKILISVAFMT